MNDNKTAEFNSILRKDKKKIDRISQQVKKINGDTANFMAKNTCDLIWQDIKRAEFNRTLNILQD